MSNFVLEEFMEVMRDSMPSIRFEEMVISVELEFKRLQKENAELKRENSELKSRDRDQEILCLKEEIERLKRLNIELNNRYRDNIVSTVNDRSELSKEIERLKSEVSEPEKIEKDEIPISEHRWKEVMSRADIDTQEIIKQTKLLTEIREAILGKGPAKIPVEKCGPDEKWCEHIETHSGGLWFHMTKADGTLDPKGWYQIPNVWNQCPVCAKPRPECYRRVERGA
jgi:hypothetical protein